MKKVRYRRDLYQIIPEGGDAAEIGVAEGNFAEDILCWPCRFPRVYLVDRWRCVPSAKGDSANNQEWHDKNFASVERRVKQFGNRAVILRGSSSVVVEMVPARSLAFLNIDGDHTYPGVTQDLQCWIGKVKKGGVVALHDYEAPQYGVKAAVNDFCREHGFELHLLPEDSLDDAGAYFFVC